MDLLKQLREEQDEEALKQGNHWVESDRLFTKENGEPQHPNATYERLKRFCKKTKFHSTVCTVSVTFSAHFWSIKGWTL